MKKSSLFLFLWLSLILSAFPLAAQEEFRLIRDGVEYAEIERGTKEEPLRVNLLRLDLKKVRLDVVHAMDAAVGLEKTSSIAARHGAIAAVNAGFFRLDTSIFAGEAAGVLQIDGRLLSESVNDRIALGIVNGKDKTEIEFAHLQSRGVVGFGTDSEITFSGINRERKSDEIILFTPDFQKTTLTDATGTEIILRSCSKDGITHRCEKSEVVEKKGSSPIPPDGFVISIGKDAVEKSNGVLIFAGKNSSQPTRFERAFRIVFPVASLGKEKQRFFSKAEDITNGVSQLIRDGKIEITWEREKASRSFAETRHPRTAVAKLKDGRFLMMTVDGRQPDWSVGMSLAELAAFLLEMGAVDALNLDGGGSTTMFLDGKVVNRPSDKEGERRVGDALLVTPRAGN